MRSWEAVADRYEVLLERVCAARGPGPLPTELCDAPPPPAQRPGRVTPVRAA